LKKNLTKLCYAICAVMLLCHLSGCSDPTVTDRGNTLNFQTISLYHIDTCSVVLTTVPDRQVVSSGVTQGVLGSANDIFFGKSYAGIYAQCGLYAGSPPNFAGCVLDSTVLVMPYVNSTSKYGKCDRPTDILVYQISQDMIPGNIYYTGDAFSVLNQPIGQRLNFVPDLVDSAFFIDPIIANNVDVPYYGQVPMMRIRLSNAFGNQLLNANDTNYLASSTFLEFFKGIYVTSNPNKVGDGFTYVNLANSAINLYYHHVASVPMDTCAFPFQISTYGVTLNHFDHYYGNTLVQGALNNPNPNGDKVAYVQAGGGVRVKLTLPNLKSIDTTVVNGKKVYTPIGITKAELIVPILDTLLSDPSYPPPGMVSLYRVDDTLGIDPLNDNQYTNVVGSSGTGILTTRLDNNGQSYVCYVFNITLYIQRVLNGYYSNNNGYYISYSSSSAANRVILLNDKTDKTKLSRYCQLKITYSNLK
jgi:hypothetical protein